jgi:hypothetical protein
MFLKFLHSLFPKWIDCWMDTCPVCLRYTAVKETKYGIVCGACYFDKGNGA